MRTTLNIDDDILHAVKELAASESKSVGHVLSRLAREGLKEENAVSTVFIYRNGIPVLRSRGEQITSEHVRELMDEEDIESSGSF
jgi:hypothetical protein